LLYTDVYAVITKDSRNLLEQNRHK